MTGSTGLLDRRLIVVLGKGGVGRTTLTAALGVAIARRGKRACVVELGEGSALAEKFGLNGRSYAFRRGMPGVDVWSLTARECLEEFAGRKLKLPPFARRVVRNRMVTTFIDAVPGMQDLLVLGRIENLVSEPDATDPKYDVLIVDAPATGHGLTLLQSARTMADITRAGPFHELAKGIELFLADRARTATVLATLPEELPVNEVIELAAALRAEGFDPGAVIANQVETAAIPDPPGAGRVLDVLAGMPDGGPLHALVTAEVAREARHARALDELRARAGSLGIRSVLRAPRAERDTVRRVGMALAEVL